MAYNPENRRKHTRLPLQFKAEFIMHDKKVFSGKTKDISFGGIYMYCRNATQDMVGSGGKLRIILQAGTDDGYVDLTGRIARVDAEGLGIQFVSIGVDDYQRFRNLMLYNNPNPEVLIEELKKSPGIDIK
jgi:hypothetical protein